MIYSKHQQVTLNTFLVYYKLGEKNKIKNDLQKMKLKGNIERFEKSVTSNYNNLEKNNILKEIFIFNKDGNILEEHYNNNEILFKLNEYDLSGNITYSQNFKEENEILYEEFYFLNKQNRVSKKERIKLGEKKITEWFEYDYRGYLISIDKLDYDVDDYFTQTFDYDFNGILKKHYFFDGKTLGRFIKNNYTKSGGNTIKESTLYLSDDKIFSKTIEILNNYGDVILKKLDACFSPNILETTYVYTYDDNSNWTSRKKFLSGNLSETINMYFQYYK
ncbi:hypothetical protein [Flavobacterium gawalongense]|uniref:Uncharacterized protein n=1 Tax=Flavobacterium gawalongense TaxID=2594432 RepID=A0A553BD53_9FLAO|nr:hypothetical protein [Flavobacterium gawalongense]TRX06185.1 hypothetical protein FNW11_14895 [Flavobacterium gawalongense]